MSDSVFIIEIKTEADLKRVEELKKQFNVTEQSAKSFEEQIRHLETSLAQMGGKTRIASEGVFQFFNSLRGVENLTSVFGELAASGFVPIIAGATALVGALEVARESVVAFMKVEEAMIRVDAALAQKGLLSGEMRERIQGLAEDLRNTTNIASAEWLPVMARLIQFGADETNIDKYSEAVKNLAGIMGGDIEQAAHIFTRVMQGNTTFLHRYGIQVAEGATTTETLNNAMEEIAKVGAGQLEARAETLTGKMRGLKISLEEVFERIGSSISATGIFQAAIQLLTDDLDSLKEHLGLVVPELDKLTNAIGVHGRKVRDAKESWDEFVQAQKAGQDNAALALKGASESARFALEELALKKKLAETEREIIKLEIERRENAREITHEEAARQKGALEQKGKSEDADTAQETARIKRDEKRRESGLKTYRVLQLGKEVEQLESAMGPADKASIRREQDLEQIRKAKEKIAQNNAAIARANMGTGIASILGGPFVGAEVGAFGRLTTHDKLAENKRLQDEINKLTPLVAGEVDPQTGKLEDPKVVAAKKLKAKKEEKQKAEKDDKDAAAESARADEEFNRTTELRRKIQEATKSAEKKKTQRDTEKGAAEDQKREIQEDEAQQREADRILKARGLDKFKFKGGMGPGLGEALQAYHEGVMEGMGVISKQVSGHRDQIKALTSRVNDARNQ